MKLQFMGEILRDKFNFEQNPILVDKLEKTADAELIEGNTWGDRFWGQCPVGIGCNELGKLLMKIRGEIK